ncbi:hypothetical protein FAVG1_09225 [Fusarium avenaceum]|nr:hypothetical protein FAVG1_09225 [Fusarium avenaceum]
MSTSTASVSVVSAHKPLESLPQEPAPNPTSQRLEQEYDTYDDSALSCGPHTSTASVISSILEYRNFKGRAYDSTPYDSNDSIPIDQQALENFDLMHHFSTLLTNDKLYLAPVKEDIQKVLDIGTGTGDTDYHDTDYADEHPNTAVIGTDLSPTQPAWIPSNLMFEVDDCTAPWKWDANTFDFVHMRYLFGAITDWTALFKEAYSATKPGGWVESCESEPMTHSDDGTVTNDGSTVLGGIWDRVFIEGGRITGCSLSVLTEDLQIKGMKEAGFVDIQEAFYKVPFGSWPEDARLAEIGQFAKLSLESDLVGYSQMIWQEVLKWPAHEYQIFLHQVRQDLRNKKLHPYFQVRFVWGRKPEEGEST